MFVSEDRPSRRTIDLCINRIATTTQGSARCYGRFLQTDPVGYEDGMNMYDYVGGDPVNRSDPSGMVDISSNYPFFPSSSGGLGFFNLAIQTPGPNGSVSIGYGAVSGSPGYRASSNGTGSGSLTDTVSGDVIVTAIINHISFVGNPTGEFISPQNGDGQEIVVTAYWRKQQAAGNPIARLGLQFCYSCSADWSTAFARRSLIGAIAHVPINGRYPSAAQVRATYGQIRVALMNADQAARLADTSGIRGLLSAGQIYDYHASVYSSFGLSSSTFGGSYFTGSRSEAIATSGYWCAGCDQ